MQVRALPVLLLGVMLVAVPGGGAFGLDTGATASASVPLNDDPYEDHLPIRIDGDDDFEQPTEISGVVGGSGTPEDPYLIEGWRIQPINARYWDGAQDLAGENCLGAPVIKTDPGRTVRLNGIELAGTDAHVIIRNNFIHARERTEVLGSPVDSKWRIGILLRNADNVTIENNVIGTEHGPSKGQNLYRAICAKNSDNLTIAANIIRRTVDHSLEVRNSGSVKISGNTIRTSLGTNGHSDGIRIGDVTNLRVEGNDVTHQDRHGIWTTRINSARFVRNTIRANSFLGLFVSDSEFVTVESNIFAQNGDDGLSLSDSRHATIRHNNIEDNGGLGIYHRNSWPTAEMNWWGCPDGPDDPACDDANPGVDYDPWATEPIADAGASI